MLDFDLILILHTVAIAAIVAVIEVTLKRIAKTAVVVPIAVIAIVVGGFWFIRSFALVYSPPPPTHTHTQNSPTSLFPRNIVVAAHLVIVIVAVVVAHPATVIVAVVPPLPRPSARVYLPNVFPGIVVPAPEREARVQLVVDVTEAVVNEAQVLAVLRIAKILCETIDW